MHAHATLCWVRGSPSGWERGTFGVSLTDQGRPHSRRRQTFGSFTSGCRGRGCHHGNKVRLFPVNGAGRRRVLDISIVAQGSYIDPHGTVTSWLAFIRSVLQRSNWITKLTIWVIQLAHAISWLATSWTTGVRFPARIGYLYSSRRPGVLLSSGCHEKSDH